MVPTSLVYAQDGKTIFADDRKGTLKAMKQIVKSIGVSKKGSCLFCHVKEGGKPKFPVDTANKRIVRMMKIGFIDSLMAKGEVTLDLTESEHKTHIVAVYRAKGENAGIHLTATAVDEHGEGEGEAPEPHTVSGRVDLPKEGEPITCMTCHNGELHFLTKMD